MARWPQRRRDTAMLAARRAEAVDLTFAGVRAAEIAERLGVSRAAVSKWLRAYRDRGEAGIRPVPRRGRPAKTTPAMRAGLAEILARGPEGFGAPGDRWTLAGISAACARTWGVRYSRGTIYRLLQAQGFRWSRPPSSRAVRTVDATSRPARLAWFPGPRVLRLLRRPWRSTRGPSRAAQPTRGRPSRRRGTG